MLLQEMRLYIKLFIKVYTFAIILMKGFLKIVSPLLITACFILACNDEKLLTEGSATLQFSADTVYFDTILATLGSVTQRFKIYNVHDRPIQISDLYLAKGTSSPYRLNVDGEQGASHSNIIIPADDSIYVFVEVTIDPQDSDSPLIVKDSVICITNGNFQDVKLIAYGQDVHLFRNEIIKTQTWNSEKPYLIVNNVAIDSMEVLNIEPGTVVYLHNNSSLFVWGRLEARGTLEEPILFTSARFDEYYELSAGQWGTIYIHPRSTGNMLEYVTIRNANAGLQVGYPDEKTKSSIELRNCMILNSASFGIYSFGGNITAYNTIIADCGMSALGLFMGGEYNFYHCTISNVSAYYPGYYRGGYKSRSHPTLWLRNYFDWAILDDHYRVIGDTLMRDLNLNMANSIVYGVLQQEIVKEERSSAGFNYYFNHCLIKNIDSFDYDDPDSLDYDDPEHFNAIVLNENPNFINDSIAIGDYDFQLDTLSPAKDSGDIQIIQRIPLLEFDYLGNSRADGYPDLGAYERNE